MWHRARPRDIPRRYDDNVRGHISSLISLAAPAILIAPMLWLEVPDTSSRPLAVAFMSMSVALVAFFVVYVVWTHRLFARGDQAEVRRIAALQYARSPGLFARMAGFGGALDWALGAAAIALAVSVGGSLVSSTVDGIWMPVLILCTTAGAWVTMTYAFALRYFRLDAAGERIEFDIDEEPCFTDFVSMAVMVSSVGAMSGGTPRTRASLSTVRNHTIMAFAFNAFVVAMVISLVSGYIAAAA